MRCPYCGNSVIVPEELRPKRRSKSAAATDAALASLPAEELEEIKRLLGEGKKIEAIKVYRQVTTLGLKEAKDAVEAIAAADPELKDKLPAGSQGGSIWGKILVGLFFFAIALIFPVVFFPVGIDAWQARQYAASFFAFLGAVIWAVIWGGIGGFIWFTKP